MKPALFYAIVRAWGVPRICAATTERSGWRGRVWGRDDNGNATNWAPRDEEGRFNTEAEAKDALGVLDTRLIALKARCKAARAELDAANEEYAQTRARLLKELSTYDPD